MYPGVLAVSMRKYVYAVLLLAHAVPLPPTSEEGLSIERLSLKLGKGSRYIGGARSRGSLPKVDNAAMILDALGYELCAVPKGHVPDDAITVDF